MPSSRRKNPEGEAQRLLDELKIVQLPIDVQTVIDAVGAVVTLQRMGPDVSGMTYRDGQRTIIGLNSAHSRKRQRFTAAHELGHITLHPGRPLTVDSNIRVNFRDQVSSQATDTEEIEANAFAAALIMPREAVLREAHRQMQAGVRSRERLTAELAAIFDVSPEAMGYRLINLGVASAP